MQQDKTITDFLNNDYQDIWQLIAENKIDVLLQRLKPLALKQSILAKLFNKGQQKVATDKLYDIIYELFKNAESKTLSEQEFKIMDAKSDGLFKNLIRLLFAIDINGNYPRLKEMVGDKLYSSTQTIAAEIRGKANGYPAGPINGQVWMGGAGMRAAFDCFSYYYERNNLPESQLWVTKMRTSITLSIMGHYKNIVGPDMIEVAELEEKWGNADEALRHYKAVILDFENEVDYFNDNLEEQPDYDERTTLTSLLKSYLNVDRIENTTKYKNEIQLIEQILKRDNQQDETNE